LGLRGVHFSSNFRLCAYVTSPDRPFVVGLSGPTGTGKTALGAHMGERPDAVFLREPDPSAMLVRMLRERDIRAVEIQDFLVRERHRLIQEAIRNARAGQVVLVDRLPSEDRAVFFELHHSTGSISASELARLLEVVSELGADPVEPDLVLFMSADKLTLRRRLSSRPEGVWLLEHLDLQLTLYRDYRRRLETSGRPMHTIDTSGLGPEELLEQARLCWDLIEASRRG